MTAQKPVGGVGRGTAAWRLLMLVPYLQAHQGVSVADAARDFGVTPAALRKELEALWLDVGTGVAGGDLVDIDVDAVDGEDCIFIGNADYLSRPMRLNPDEVMSLIVALQVVHASATGDEAAAARSASAKLEDMLEDARQAARVEVAVAAGDDAVRAQLAGSITNRERVRLTYDGENRGATTQPTVDPDRIEVRDGAAYLVAFRLDAGQWRIYRLDRIRAVEPSGEHAVNHGVAPGVGDWFAHLGPEAEVTLTLGPEAAWMTEYVPTRELVRLADDRVRARFVVADPGWLTRQLLRLGAGVERVDPPSAAADARRVASETIERYRQVFDSGV